MNAFPPVIVARFWSKVRIPECPNHGNLCWEWVRATNGVGYGKMKIGRGKTLDAHRMAYEMFHGPVPPGLQVLHSCDNRLCVNPAHLRAGTQGDNVDDAMGRGRLLRDAASGRFATGLLAVG